MDRKTKAFMSLTAAFGLLLGAATVAVAAPAGGPSASKAERMEARQGKKNAGHRAKKRAARFARADKNGDGFLTRAEVGEKRWQRISVADSNNDAKVSRAELQQAHKDGKLTKKGKKGKKGKRGKRAKGGQAKS